MVRIREATLADSEALAALSGQLGYPADGVTLARRLGEVAEYRVGVVLVAEAADGCIAGWAHAMPERALVFEPRVQLAGLVVDEHQRGAGIGLALLHAAEAWGRERGFAELVVRSNVIRERAHRFYVREDYAEKKRQVVFVKRL